MTLSTLVASRRAAVRYGERLIASVTDCHRWRVVDLVPHDFAVGAAMAGRVLEFTGAAMPEREELC